MKANFKYILFWFIYSGALVLQAQNMDSLKIALKNATQDSTKLKILSELGLKCNPSEILVYSKPAIELADKLLKDQTIQNKKNIKQQKALVLNNIGTAYDNLGNVSKALEYYSESLKLYESINDRGSISALLNNLGVIYGYQNDYKKALENFEKSLKIQEELGDKLSIGYFLVNIGFISSQMGNNDKAFKDYNRSIKLLEEVGDKPGLAMALNNTGLLYQYKKEYTNALTFFNRSLKLREGIKENYGIASSLNSIASVYLEQGNYKQALLYSDSSLIISRQLGYPVVIAYAEQTRSKIDSATNNFIGALKHYKQFILYKDSTRNEKTRKASVKNQLKYEFEKKEAVLKEQQEKERAVAEEKNRFQKIVIWTTAIGLILVIAFAVFIFRTLNITKQQKHLIEEKQKEILDSIRYAKRIQNSLLPTEKYITKHLYPSQKK